MKDILIKHGIPHSTATNLAGLIHGYCIGATAGVEYMVSGASVWVHEVVGHGLLGGHLVHNYLPHQMPHYQIAAFDALREIPKASGPWDFIKKVYHWQTGGLRTPGEPLGRAWVRGGIPNALGHRMGPDGLKAWTALSGSLPALGINTSLGVAGVHLKEKCPTLGYALIFFALVDHLGASAYAWDAVFKSADRLKELEKSGHDFVRFGQLMSAMTGYRYRGVATLTAVLYSGFLPTFLILAELHVRSRAHKLVPDEQAVFLLYQSNRLDEDTITTLRGAYPRKVAVDLSQMESAESWLFANFIASQLPRHQMRAAKQEILDRKRRGSPSTLQGRSGWVMLSSGLGVAGCISALLSTTAFPRLSRLTAVLKYGAPLTQTVAVVGAVAECRADWRSERSVVPTSAKIVSSTKVAFLGLTLLGSFGLFPSRMSGYALAGSLFLPMGLDYLKHRFIAKQWHHNPTF